MNPLSNNKDWLSLKHLIYFRKLLHALLCYALCLIVIGSNAQVSLLRQCSPGQEFEILLHHPATYGDDAAFNQLLDSLKPLDRDARPPFLVHLAQLVRTGHLDATREVPTAQLKLEREAAKWNNEEIRGFLYLRLGDFYYHRRDFPNAFHYIVLARDIFEQRGYENLRFGGIYTSDLFGYYYFFEDYYTAIAMVEKCIKINRSHPSSNAFNINNLGLAYQKTRQYDKAVAVFKEVIDTMHGDSTYAAIASANLGNTLRLQGHYAAALPHLYTELHLNPKKAPEDCALTCLYVADCLLHLDSIEKARKYIDLAPTFGPDYVYTDYKLHLHEVMSLYCLKTKQYEKAAQYQQALMLIKDSLKNLFDTRILLATTLQDKEKKILQAQQRGEQKAARIRLVRNIIILLLSVAFLAVLFFILQKSKKEQQQQQQRQQEAETKLRQAQENLQHYIASIKEKNDLIEKIEHQLLTFQSKEESRKTRELLEQLHQSVILTEEDWVNFKHLCEQVWPYMFTEMSEQFPDLSPAEERLLALSRLDISSKQMAGMLGISQDSLRKSRYRLRKKYPSLSDMPESGEEEMDNSK